MPALLCTPEHNNTVHNTSSTLRHAGLRARPQICQYLAARNESRFVVDPLHDGFRRLRAGFRVSVPAHRRVRDSGPRAQVHAALPGPGPRVAQRIVSARLQLPIEGRERCAPLTVIRSRVLENQHGRDSVVRRNTDRESARSEIWFWTVSGGDINIAVLHSENSTSKKCSIFFQNPIP